MKQDFPRVYRLRAGWRNTFAVVGAILAVGGFIGAFFARQMSEFPAGQVVTAVIFLGFAVMGICTVLGVLRTRVVLHADTIELQGTFSKRSLWRPDIAGRRLMSMQHGAPVIRLQPRSESLSRIMVMPQYLQTDAVFEEWMATIPDLDSAEADASLDSLLEDPAIPGTRDEKLSGLVRARRIATWLTWVSLAVFFWLWIYPHPYDLALVCGVVLPWIAVILVARGGALYKFSPERNDAAAGLFGPVTLPGFALLIRALFDSHVFDWQNMLLAVIATLAVCTLIMWCAMSELRASVASTAAIAFFMAPYAYGTATLANKQLDFSEPERFEAKVMGSHISRGKSTEYYLELGPWGPRTEAEDVDVGRVFYERGSRQDTVCVYLYRGALGVRWFEVWDCPRS